MAIAGIQALHCPLLDAVMPVITALGNAGAVWLLCAVVLVCTKRHRRAGVLLLCALVLSALVGSLILKPLIGRLRPFAADPALDLIIRAPDGFSFPSGHTSSSFAAALSLTLCDRRIGIPALVLAALIAFSRLYLMVHYLSDVVAGILLGCTSALLVRLAGRLLRKRWPAR